MSIIGGIHARRIFPRRIQRLTAVLADRLPQQATVLDIGCGDGSLSAHIGGRRPDVRITGVEVLVREATQIPVTRFDGSLLPFPDGSFDVVMFVDVLHHTQDPRVLLQEAARVARHVILIKDHVANGILDRWTLKLMDYVGNAHHGVALPYTYWSLQQWSEAWRQLQVEPFEWTTEVDLYPWPLTLACDRSLHFVASLRAINPRAREVQFTSSPGSLSSPTG